MGCSTAPERTIVQDPDIPDYGIVEHRIDEPIDLYIEPRIPVLTTGVLPVSGERTYPEVTVVAGPALEKALLTLTRQHFSRATAVARLDGKPTLVYRLLTFKPTIAVKPGGLRSQLDVSARVAIQVAMQTATGEYLFSTTAIGTSHVSDTRFTPNGRLKGHGELLEAVTRNAIIDVMYEISKMFDNDGDELNAKIRASATVTDASIETLDDVILYLRTVAPVAN
ncbi:MAG: hypothetical protein KJO31_10775 [Gammaproteobacteria bacterium]|nr:hypothetical protein [Gammaproteobacteria bacterium]